MVIGIRNYFPGFAADWCVLYVTNCSFEFDSQQHKQKRVKNPDLFRPVTLLSIFVTILQSVVSVLVFEFGSSIARVSL